MWRPKTTRRSGLLLSSRPTSWNDIARRNRALDATSLPPPLPCDFRRRVGPGYRFAQFAGMTTPADVCQAFGLVYASAVREGTTNIGDLPLPHAAVPLSTPRASRNVKSKNVNLCPQLPRLTLPFPRSFDRDAAREDDNATTCITTREQGSASRYLGL